MPPAGLEGVFLAALFNISLHHRRVPDREEIPYCPNVQERRQNGTDKLEAHTARNNCFQTLCWLPSGKDAAVDLRSRCAVQKVKKGFCHMTECSSKGSYCKSEWMRHVPVEETFVPESSTSPMHLAVTHTAVVKAVQSSGAWEAFTAIIKDLYGAKTTIVAEGGCTELITISAGVRQGCPLTGLLFNLIIGPVVRAMQGGERHHGTFAYADARTPLADGTTTLQTRIEFSDNAEEPYDHIPAEELVNDFKTRQQMNASENVLGPLVTWLRSIHSQPVCPDTWAGFESVLKAAIETVAKAVRLPHRLPV